MKTKNLVMMTSALVLLAGPALAQNQAALCKLWFTHKNTAKSAAYQPGVDVNGNPVTPADVNAPIQARLNEKVRIPVTVDLAQQLGLNLPAGTEMNAMATMVDIHDNGKVTYNGQDLTQQTYAVCTGNPAPAAAATGAAQVNSAEAMGGSTVTNMNEPAAPQTSQVAAPQAPQVQSPQVQEPATDMPQSQLGMENGYTPPAVVKRPDDMDDGRGAVYTPAPAAVPGVSGDGTPEISEEVEDDGAAYSDVTEQDIIWGEGY